MSLARLVGTAVDLERVLHPATASHRDLAPVRRQELGINDGLVRVSVGIESVNDIIADIEQALEAGTEPGAAATG